MENFRLTVLWISLLIPLSATLISLLYGLRHFFKKGKPLFVQSLTLAMGSYALGNLYQLLLSFSTNEYIDGFTPMYLGKMGFFLFIITASYGQLDRIVDDGSVKMRPAKFVALIAPCCVALLYVPVILAVNTSTATMVIYAILWLLASFSAYFNLKHAIIPDFDFNFIKAIKPYNFLVLCLSFSELLYLISLEYTSGILTIVLSVLFSVLCICTMVAARKGVEKWVV